jgi:cell division protein FtsA
MAKDRIIVGLEIGTTKVCVAVGEARPDGTLSILAISEVPSRGVRKGEIIDPDTAQRCVKDAIADAEEKADVMIRSVFLGITGGHIASFNNRSLVTLPDEEGEIAYEDCHAAREAANAVSLPSGHSPIHSILQHYYVDGGDGVVNPIGMFVSKLVADFHIIHGVANRLKNAVRCVKEIELEVEDVVFCPFATAQVAIDENQKNLGALVVDIGGGTTDYIVYQEGAVRASGVLAVGGDHVTQDISMGLRIPMARAERVKCEEGSAQLGLCIPGETLSLKDESGFAGREIERETLNTIAHLRIREIFEILKKRLEPAHRLELLGAGVFITGGTSRLHGIKSVAEEVFGLPVHLPKNRAMSGPTSALDDPRFATGLGLVRYGEVAQPQSKPGFLDKFLGRLRRFNLFNF